jgi:signal transduction histidine kinase
MAKILSFILYCQRVTKTKSQTVFKRFFTTKPAGSGTGLGLSISYDIIVNQHHGELRVESTEGEFAEFIIVLPRVTNTI